MLRKLFSSSFNNVGRISQISSLASTIHTLIPSASQKRMIVSTLKSTSESCANVLSKIEREEGFQISRSDLNRWTKLFEKQGQTQKSLEILRFKELKYLALMNHFKLCSGKKNTDPDYFGRSSLKTAASIIAPSVVNITKAKDLYGSGVVFSEKHIITCAHMFELSPPGSSMEVLVTTNLDQSFIGTVVDSDLDYDLALVKIKSPVSVSLSPAKFGHSKDMAVGDWVMSVGYPHQLSNSLSMGIIGHLNRSQVDLQVPGKCQFYLQTDCWLDEGSSGGALVNLEGEVVGLNCSYGVADVGIGFAIPIETVVMVMKKKNWLP